MGIAGSVVKDEFWSKYLGMRNEYIDMSEFDRRVRENISAGGVRQGLRLDQENFKQGEDFNEADQQMPDQCEGWWEYCTKMTLIARDLMVGNPRLDELGFGEEALGHGAIAAGFGASVSGPTACPAALVETILRRSSSWNSTALCGGQGDSAQRPRCSSTTC